MFDDSQIEADPAVRSFRQDGYSVLPRVVGSAKVRHLTEAITGIDPGNAVRTRGGVYAVRNLLEVSAEMSELAHSREVLSLVDHYLGKPAFPVRGTLFDKTGTANWLVPWHQDLTICVTSRRDAPGFGPWTIKAGVCHVQPPASILEQMLSVRIHLDGCDESNGALRVLPGTHLHGRMTAAEIQAEHSSRTAVCCNVQSGDVV